jgi:hypothetical protein
MLLAGGARFGRNDVETFSAGWRRVHHSQGNNPSSDQQRWYELIAHVFRSTQLDTRGRCAEQEIAPESSWIIAIVGSESGADGASCTGWEKS